MSETPEQRAKRLARFRFPKPGETCREGWGGLCTGHVLGDGPPESERDKRARQRRSKRR